MSVVRWLCIVEEVVSGGSAKYLKFGVGANVF